MQEVQEMWVGPLGQEDTLKEEMASDSSILAWKISGRGAWWATVYGVANSWTRLSVYNHDLGSRHIHRASKF